MKIRIKSLDTLFFRDGKPFNRGDDTWANGIFPPPPSVIYGALRSAFLSQKGFHDNNIKKSENLVIHQILLEREGNQKSIVSIAPYDLVVSDKGEEDEEIHVLQLEESNSISNYPGFLTHQLYPPFEEDKRMNVDSIGGTDYLIDNLFDEYLNNSTSRLNYYALPELITVEPKVGIGRENETRFTEESALYRVGMQRLEGNAGRLNIILEFSGIELAENGVLKIGAENKVASYEDCEDYESTNDALQVSDYFKLYLATPAIFDKGWIPSWIDNNGFGIIGNVKVKLVAAAIGKPVSIGGFDMKLRKPKTMYKAVPAGSVYYFKLLEGTTEDLYAHFHQQCISDKKAKEGFGLTFIGDAKKQMA